MARASTAAVTLLAGVREPARVVAVASVDLAELQIIDGVLLEAGDRVLLTAQDDETENGLYTASAGDWYRASDARSARSITKGMTVRVQSGTTYAGTHWEFNTVLPNIGVDDIEIEQLTASGITAADLGLGNVNNTSDADKPISDAVQEELDDIVLAQRGHIYGLALTRNLADSTNDVDLAAGHAAAADGSIMALNSALTKRIDAAWTVGTGNGGLDTGSIANNTYYIWLIGRSDTGVVDALFSLSATAPTMPTNYDRKRLIGTLIRASAANQLPIANAKTERIGPDIQVFLSGSAQTYTTPLGSNGQYPLYLRVRMIGGSGGGGARATNDGSAGGTTSFGSWTALAGAGGLHGTSGNITGGAGGSGGADGTGTLIARIAGAAGQAGISTASTTPSGGIGGTSPFGGAGAGTAGGAGGNAVANSGSGGAGAAGINVLSAGGGGAGEYVEFIIPNPAPTYTYTVGAAGAGGAAGGAVGGNGAAGRIEVVAHF